MNVQGRDCTLAVITPNGEMDIPYSEETIREAVSLLEEYPSIEGNGNCKAIKTSSGAVGCVVTSLTIKTAPLLFCLALGETPPFGLLQYRCGERKFYPACQVKGYELRILRDESIKLKLDIASSQSPVSYPHADNFAPERGERFKGDNARYLLDGREYANIYGVTLSVKKADGIKTELRVRRVLERGADLPESIGELCITARLLRDKYGDGRLGEFRISLKKLALRSDETSVECDDAVIGQLRYFVSGEVAVQ